MYFFWILWFFFGFLALWPAAFIFYYMKFGSREPWPTKVDSKYKPKISIIVPTYNESSIILFKLMNLSRLKYPLNLSEVIIVDSNSSDNTVGIVRQFLESEPPLNLKILVEEKRKGKSHALNYALEYCTGNVIIVSDADCFWPSDILEKAMPFLADPAVGAISGPKLLINANQTWVTRLEECYLNAVNNSRVGESKAGSTVFFEGGFSAFKREAFDRFDPYDTGSDDCGTAIQVIEKGFRAMLVSDAFFYSSFPSSFKGKISVKLRRASQLVRVFAKCLDLFIKGKVKIAKKTVFLNTFLYLFSPPATVVLVVITTFVIFSFPFLLLSFILLIIPRIRFYFYQLFESNLVLFASLLGKVLGKKFSVWEKPQDRWWLTKEALSRLNLI